VFNEDLWDFVLNITSANPIRPFITTQKLRIERKRFGRGGTES
jgi:hypothetical protein